MLQKMTEPATGYIHDSCTYKTAAGGIHEGGPGPRGHPAYITVSGWPDACTEHRARSCLPRSESSCVHSTGSAATVRVRWAVAAQTHATGWAGGHSPPALCKTAGELHAEDGWGHSCLCSRSCWRAACIEH